MDEEEYFEANFSYEDSPRQNLRIAVCKLYDASKEVSMLAEKVSDGEVFSTESAIRSLKDLFMAGYYCQIFNAQAGTNLCFKPEDFERREEFLKALAI